MKLLVLFLCIAAAHARRHKSAASDAQIKFAIENKYDDTGPGAKDPEQNYAYKTFANLEEALVGYIDDPDTKLPDADRARAYHKLVKPLRTETIENLPKYYRVSPKTVEDYTSKQKDQPIYVTRYTFPDKKVYYHEPGSKLGIFDLRGMDYKILPRLKAEHKFKKSRLLKPSPVNLGQYSKDEAVEPKDPSDSSTEYTYSYGVHDRHTGDQKAAHETRSNGRVSGYYTVMDADGKQRTVRYTADDKEGFRAVVQRTNTNNQ